MDTTFPLLGLTVHAYGLCIAIGVLMLLATMGILGYLDRMPAGTVRVFGLMGIPLGIIGARLVYCVFNFSSFTENFENPWLVLNFFDGGLSMGGLLCGLVLAAFITAKMMKVRFGRLLDVLCVPLGLFIAFLRWAERFTDLGVGKVIPEGGATAAMPWMFLRSQMGVNTEYRLAVFDYEAMAGMLIFVVMIAVFMQARKHKQTRSGDAALFFFTLYGATQIFFESMRDDGHMLLIFLRIGQLAAAFMPLIAAGILSQRYIHIKGKGDMHIIATWAVLLICVVGLILLEFSLDGRITWGNPTLLRDYSIMAVLCGLLFAMPCSLYITLHKKLYHEEHISVHVSEASLES